MPLRSLDGVWRHFSFASTSRLCWRQGCVLSRDPPISSCKGGRQVKRKRRDSRQPRAVAPVCRCKTRAGVGAERRPKRRKVSGPSRKVCPPAAPVALDPPFFLWFLVRLSSSHVWNSTQKSLKTALKHGNGDRNSRVSALKVREPISHRAQSDIYHI